MGENIQPDKHSGRLPDVTRDEWGWNVFALGYDHFRGVLNYPTREDAIAAWNKMNRT